LFRMSAPCMSPYNTENRRTFTAFAMKLIG
jgi:hypothetical protein